MTALTATPSWQALMTHHAQIKDLHLRDLFADDPGRAERFSAEGAGIFLDYSKNRITDETLRLLLRLAEERGVMKRRDAMYAGEKINTTERRAVLHVALRAPRGTRIEVDGADVVPDVHKVLDAMSAFATRLRSGAFVGHTGKRIRNVVNIGIGGSYLGPEMAYRALRPFSDRSMTFRFVANVDGADFSEATHDLDAAETLFIVSSKTFTTLGDDDQRGDGARLAGGETRFGRGGGEAFRRGLHQHRGGDQVRHRPGQYVRLLGLGRRPLFDGQRDRPVHDDRGRARTISAPCWPGSTRWTSISAPRRRPQPAAAAGLLTVWYNNFFGAQTIGIMPYAAHLARFPAYLQQLQMESNGKHVDLDGHVVNYQTGPIIWGEPGTDGQHSFYQLLHQGTKLVPCDMIGFCQPLSPLSRAARPADGQSVRAGRGAGLRQDGSGTEGGRLARFPDAVPRHRGQPADQHDPCRNASIPRRSAALVALYEHSVFTQGAIWAIDSFDQWGVELGKALANRIIPELDRGAEPKLTHDASTNALISRYRRQRDTRR